MKKVAVIAAAGLALASAAAYAQMQHGPSDRSATPHAERHMMGPGRMHGPMMHGQMMPDHSTHGATGSHTTQPKGDTGPSSLAFHGINTKMHSAMDIAFTGDADVDFVKGMVPHHQGAIDMAKTVLAFGKNPEVRKLAEDIVRTQESEIALMQEWLKKNGR